MLWENKASMVWWCAGRAGMIQGASRNLGANRITFCVFVQRRLISKDLWRGRY